MICDMCNGKGWYENPKVNHVSNVIAWERGYTNPIKCRKCGGSGFLLGNADEIIKRLDFAIKTHTPLDMRELKQLKLVLTK